MATKNETTRAVEEIAVEPASPKTSGKPDYEKENTLLKAQLEELKKSFEAKSQEYNKLLEAYKSLAIRYTNDGKAARAFIETAHIGIDLLYPKENN